MSPRTRSYLSLAAVAVVGTLVLKADGEPAATETAKAAAVVPPAPVSALTYEKDIQPLLATYCYECHGNGQHKGGLTLDTVKDASAIQENRKVWETLLRYVRTREMPPEEAKNQPSQEVRDLLTDWVEKELYKYDPAHPDPGHVTYRRLNRAEYNHTIRDLIGVDFQPAQDFPVDDSGYGFDNIGDVLSLPPILLEKYLNAANKILDQAIVTDPINSQTLHLPATLATIGFNAIGDRGDGWIYLISLEEDGVSIDYNAPVAGDYLFRFQAYGNLTGGRLVGQGSSVPLQPAEGEVVPQPILSVVAGTTVIKDIPITTDADHPQVYEARLGLPAGHQRLQVALRRLRSGTNDLNMTNGRLGIQQWGIGFVKFLEVEGPLPSASTRYPAAQLEISGNVKPSADGGRWLEKDGEAGIKFTVPKDGDYLLRAYAYAQQAGPEWAKLQFRVDGKPLTTFDVLAPAEWTPIAGQRLFSVSLLHSEPQVYELPVHLTAGEKRFSTALVNYFHDDEQTNPNFIDRHVNVQALEVVGLNEPLPVPPMPAPLLELFDKHVPRNTQDNFTDGLRALAGVPPPANYQSPAEQARGILADFARRAWRRPVQPAELDRLMSLYNLARQNGDSFNAGVKLAMKAVLVSPHFLFRGEQPPAIETSTSSTARPPAAGVPQRIVAQVAGAATPAAKNAPVEIVPIDEFTLATRLSYFLWSSTPDDELLDLAEHGQLRKNLSAQVHRMLTSPKARSLVDDFAGQWLQFRGLQSVEPDKKLFPDFNPAIRAEMQKETEEFCAYIINQDRSVMDFINADYTFVNEELAKYYEMEGVTGDEFRKVSLKDSGRRGIITQGSILVLTSNPTRTSPVKRGKWVLDNLLGLPPPPPPPNVPALVDDQHQLTGTLRQQMEQHRDNPSCAGCHARMDPIGFGLENFNGVGAWRDTESDAAIDASGKLISGESFKGAEELVQILSQSKREDYLRCLAEKMLTYALGRGLEYYDRAATDQIVHTLETKDDKFSTLVMAVVDSVPFQMRRANPAATPDKVAAR